MPSTAGTSTSGQHPSSARAIQVRFYTATRWWPSSARAIPHVEGREGRAVPASLVRTGDPTYRSARCGCSTSIPRPHWRSGTSGCRRLQRGQHPSSARAIRGTPSREIVRRPASLVRAGDPTRRTRRGSIGPQHPSSARAILGQRSLEPPRVPASLVRTGDPRRSATASTGYGQHPSSARAIRSTSRWGVLPQPASLVRTGDPPTPSTPRSRLASIPRPHGRSSWKPLRKALVVPRYVSDGFVNASLQDRPCVREFLPQRVLLWTDPLRRLHPRASWASSTQPGRRV